MQDYFFKDEYGFIHVFPVFSKDTVYIGCGGQPWRRLRISEYTFMGNIFTMEMYLGLRRQCREVGTFDIENEN